MPLICAMIYVSKNNITYIHTVFATPQRGFSVTKGIKRIKMHKLKWVNKIGKESKMNYSIKNLQITKFKIEY